MNSPTNENGNGLVRRYVGKGTDLGVYSPDDLRAIEHRINIIPRRSLDWATAADRYHAAVAMTGLNSPRRQPRPFRWRCSCGRSTILPHQLGLGILDAMLTVSVNDDPAALDEVADDWQELLTASAFDDVFLGPEFSRAWWEAHGHDWNLRVVTVEDGNTLRLLAPLAVRKGTRDWQTIGSRRADYSGPVYRSGDFDAVRAFVRAIHGFDECDGISFRGVPEGIDLMVDASATIEDDDSVLYKARQFARVSRPLVRSYLVAEHPRIDRDGIVAQADRLDRKDVRYLVRWLSRHGEMIYELIDEPLQQNLALPQFFDLHVRSFDARGMVSQFTSKSERTFFESLVTELGPRGELRFDALRLDGRLIAAQVGFERNGRVGWYKPCFEPDLGRGSPGTVLLCCAIRDAYTRGLSEFDLLRGTEEYKFRYATDSRPTRTVKVESRRLRILRNRLHRLTHGAG